MLKKIKDLFYWILFRLITKDINQNWYAYNILKSIPLKYSHPINSSRKNSSLFNEIIYQDYEIGISVNNNLAIITDSWFIKQMNIESSFFRKELTEISNLIFFVNCYFLNPNYKYSIMQYENNILKKILSNDDSTYSFNSYKTVNIGLSIHESLLRSLSITFQDFVKNPVIKSRTNPYFFSNLNIYIIKGNEKFGIEREIVVACPTIDNKGVSLKLLNINDVFYFKIRVVDLYERRNEDIKDIDFEIEYMKNFDYMENFNKYDDFSIVIREYSKTLLMMVDSKYKNYIPNKNDKLLFDMENY